jgi:Uma2 family endonuclease
MSSIAIETERSVEGQVVEVADHPIRFEEFVEYAQGKYVELVDGVVVEKSMVQLDHEYCSSWLQEVIGPYVRRRKLGRLLTQRIMVKADEFGGRMPDLLFVSTEHQELLRQTAVYGAPQLVIEIISPGDRSGHLRALEADYIRLGVGEIAFVDLVKQSIRLLRRRDGEYAEEIVQAGPITFNSIDGLTLESEWILTEPRPDTHETVARLLTPVR